MTSPLLRSRALASLAALALTTSATAQAQWVGRLEVSSRTGGAAVWDSARERVVHFGGRGIHQFLDQTVEWDGFDWALRQPATRPPARGSFAMAFDATRRETVLFGGDVPPSPALGDTWTWNGHDWTQRFPTTTPGARTGAAMAFDPVRERVVLFGGATMLGSPLSNDVWEWDGTDWIRVPPGPGWPSGRGSHRMAWDPATASVLMFGGVAPGGVQFSETWSWDGQAWTRRQPLHTPPPSSTRFGMATDATAQNVVAVVQDGPALPNSTWIWDGTDWTRTGLTFGDSPTATTPLAFDGNNGLVLAALDIDSSFYGATTSLFVGSGWLTIDERFTDHLIGDLVGDLARERVVVQLNQVPTGSTQPTTWEWDGSRWDPMPESPTTPPRDVAFSAMTYDTVHSVTLWHGGFSPTVGYSTSLRSWDGTAWTIRTAPLEPPARLGAAFVFDTNRGVAVLHGGLLTDGSSATDTWEWDGATGTWSQRITANAATIRIRTCAYDPVRSRIVLGGIRGFGAQQTFEYWEFDGIDWSQVPPAIAPPYADVIAFDPLRGTLIGHTPFVAPGTWSWDGTTTTQLTGDGPASPIGLVFDAARGRMMALDGIGGIATWHLGDNLVGASATAYGTGCSGTLGVPSLAARGEPHVGNEAFRLELGSANPTSPSALLFAIGAAAVPFGGCTILVDPLSTIALPSPVASATGFAELPVRIPRDTTLYGASLNLQGIVVDPIGAAFGVLAMTAGLELTIGD